MKITRILAWRLGCFGFLLATVLVARNAQGQHSSLNDEYAKGATRGIIDFERPKDAVQLVGPQGSTLVPENPKID